MTRIANWIATWEREVKENDFTSGVFAYALKNNAISLELLQDNKGKNVYKIINKIKKSKAEAYFLREWEKLYNEVNSLIKILNKKDKSLEASRLLQTIKKLTFLHLINKKFI
jgi:geranylgeranyl pyrophosphate synthase